MSGYLQEDTISRNALMYASPNIKKFLNGLADGSAQIAWNRLLKDETKQRDGSIFRVHSFLRSAIDQVNEFKRGREGVKYTIDAPLYPTESCDKPSAVKYELVNRGKVVESRNVSTNAWAGESYHNWGLAVDLVIRKFGDSAVLNLSDGALSLINYYKMIGLDTWAKMCGLQWGGDWEDFPDVLHFEDRSWAIPEKKYWYDKNMNFAFVEQGGKPQGVAGALNRTGGESALLKLGLIGYAIYKIFVEKKRK